jgi:hypothetical protein
VPKHGFELIHLDQKGELGVQSVLKISGKRRFLHEEGPTLIVHPPIVSRACRRPLVCREIATTNVRRTAPWRMSADSSLVYIDIAMFVGAGSA